MLPAPSIRSHVLFMDEQQVHDLAVGRRTLLPSGWLAPTACQDLFSLSMSAM
jgi:hypothetical protein